MLKERGIRTLAHEFLEIEAEVFDVSPKCYKILDSILRKTKRELKDVKWVPGDTYLYTISKILEDFNFKFKGESLFYRGLQTKQIDCKQYCTLYYSIAEQLDLPLSIVRVPSHVFVRWNGKDTLNWETTSAKEHDNQFYINWLKIHEKSISNEVYLKNLTREQAKSIIFTSRGNRRHERNDLKGAFDDFTKAVEFDSDSVVAYNNRGIVKRKRGNIEGSILDYSKAIELDPNFSKAYCNRGLTKHKKGNLEDAILDFDKAIELEPEDAVNYRYRGTTKKLKGDNKGAIEDFDRAIEILEKEVKILEKKIEKLKT